jgi:hypothetical protein
VNDFGWRIYYAPKENQAPEEGPTFDNNDGEPWESPELEVVCIGQPCARGKHYDRLHNERYFIYRVDLGFWLECDLTGLECQLSTYHVWPMRRGYQLPTEDFKKICTRMLRDLDGRNAT